MKLKFAQNTDYWRQKTRIFLHDPPDKALHIPGHEERANAILDAFGMNDTSVSHAEYQEADRVASGMDRATLPGYAPGDEQRNGAVNLLENPVITHPTGDEPPLIFCMAGHGVQGSAFVKEVNRAICELIASDLGTEAGSGKGLSEFQDYRENEEAFAPARFFYLFFMLRRRLARKNIGGLGGLWHRLPADTRIPDHSVWQHSGLTSALASSVMLSEQNRASLMVYALTPVQDFVGRARKLRDSWSGSIILSWLAFEGIKAILQLYGPDHVLYPSLHDQPLMDNLLDEMGMGKWIGKKRNSGIASFPNKFVILVPASCEEKTARVIQASIDDAWQALGSATLSRVEKIVGREDPYIKELFKRQIGTYWEHYWGSAPLVKGKERQEVEKLLYAKNIETAFSFWEDSQKLYRSTGEAQLYSVSHRLAQAMLAAGKNYRVDNRSSEPGIKCDMFQEFEILHYQHQKGDDYNPKPSEDPFWTDLRNRWKPESDFGPNERLSSIGIVKRIAYRVCKEDMGNHPLKLLFKDAESFPSTTEMALTDWWNQLRNKAKGHEPESNRIAGELAVFEAEKDASYAKRALAQWFHDLEEQNSGNSPKNDPEEARAAKTIMQKLHPVKDIHKYYAVLMMDGDRMGKLVNGDTLGSTWGSVLHPVLAEKLNGNFEPRFKNFWIKRMKQPRLISPAVHAAISEALGDFALHTVPFLIEQKYGGRLVYAGGDDVCAVLPASNVLEAAREIADAYGFGFVGITSETQAEFLHGKCNPEEYEKIGIHLGRGPDISISAGIIIAHHKKPLGRVISRAHELLEQAKKHGRNGFVLEVDKRSGGGRSFYARWDNPELINSFFNVADALKEREKDIMSSSLAYRLDIFADGIRAIVEHQPGKLQAFIKKQIDRSEKSANEKTEDIHSLAQQVATILTSRKDDRNIPTEALIVANFIGHCRQERRNGEG